MNTPPAVSPALDPSGFAGRVPPTREFGLAWLSYVALVLALLMIWPLLVAVAVSMLRRDAVHGTVLASHHRFVLRTAGFATVGYLACILLVFVGAWDLIAAAAGSTPDGQFAVDWGAVLSTAGATLLGGLGMTIVWLWMIVRIVRGALRLTDARPAP